MPEQSSAPRGELHGRVFDIATGCFHDGPGLRTVVFLKGCRLRCPWCHNPEGLAFEQEVVVDASRCTGCGACRSACPLGSRAPGVACRACGACVEACPAGARRIAGRDLTVDELTAEVLRDRDFFEGTGGGVTFSGGEPLAQPAFLFACADALHAAGVSVAVETSGFWPTELAAALAEHVDLVLFDLKHVDLERFRHVTGRDGEVILENLDVLLARGVLLELRVTLVSGFNDSDADLDRIATWIGQRDPRPPVRCIPAHGLARAKGASAASPISRSRWKAARMRLRREA